MDFIMRKDRVLVRKSGKSESPKERIAQKARNAAAASGLSGLSVFPTPPFNTFSHFVSNTIIKFADLLNPHALQVFYINCDGFFAFVKGGGATTINYKGRNIKKTQCRKNPAGIDKQYKKQGDNDK